MILSVKRQAGFWDHAMIQVMQLGDVPHLSKVLLLARKLMCKYCVCYLIYLAISY